MELLYRFLAAPADFLTTYALPFVVVLSVLVFVHEWGHYIIARLCGVKIETFSIGFGKEIFGWTDRAGTRWKVSWVPLGGYVQMFGDSDPVSARHRSEVKEGEKRRPFTEAEKKVAFYTQSVAKRAAIVFAGPAINFIFAIVILTLMFAIHGQPYTPPIAGALIVGSPAEKAGIRPDDKILEMDGQPMTRFEDIAMHTSVSLDKEIEVKLVRMVKKGVWSRRPIILHVKPTIVTEVDRFGFKSQRGRIGLKAVKGQFGLKRHTPVSAFIAANKEVWEISASTLKAIGQIISGTRSSDELGGILRIGAYAGDFAKQGIVALIMFTALLSVNLGLINFLPIPMLDGGHLAFFAMETVKGKPMSERFQEYALRVGLAFLLGIMLFATWNDLVQLKVFAYVKHLMS
ncbi:MAG: RIP metalloprotease RseP [Proteobacteria bacterium]|nr:RIP metalloprotease RseP [Pseudomonadota bacterium]